MTTRDFIILFFDHWRRMDPEDFKINGQTEVAAVSRLNEAQRVISESLYLFDPSITFTLVAGQTTYNVRDLSSTSRKVYEPQAVWINGNSLLSPFSAKRGLMGYQEFTDSYPFWRTAVSGVPTVAVQLPPSSIMLYAAPNSTVVSNGNNYISGTYFAADLSASSLNATSDIPEEVQECVVRLAIKLQLLPSADKPADFNKLGLLDAHDRRLIDGMGANNKRKLTQGSAQPYYPVFMRTR